MFMRAALHGGFLLLFSVLQAALVSYAAVFGVKPNLMIIYVFVVAHFCGNKAESSVVGLLFGLFLDISIGRLIGANALCCMIFGFFVTYFCERVLGNISVIIVFFSVIILSFLYETVYYLFAFSVIGKLDMGYAVKNVIWIESIYNGIISLPLYFIFKKLTKYLYADKGETIG